MRRRTVYATLAVVCAVLGVLALAVGTVLATTFGRAEQIRSEPTALSGPGAAIIAEQLRVDASNIPLPDDVGALTVEVAPVGPRALFVGTAEAAPLDDYLTAVPYDVVTSLTPGGRAPIRSVPGSILPRPPAQESFWLAQGVGSPGQTVRLDADLGETTSLVVTNVEPSNGVEADVRVTYTVRGVWNTALGLLIGGAVLLLLMALLWWRAHAAGARARAAAAASAAAPPVAPATGTTVLPTPAEASPDGTGHLDADDGAPAVRLPPAPVSGVRAEPPTAPIPVPPVPATESSPEPATDADPATQVLPSLGTDVAEPSPGGS